MRAGTSHSWRFRFISHHGTISIEYCNILGIKLSTYISLTDSRNKLLWIWMKYNDSLFKYIDSDNQHESDIKNFDWHINYKIIMEIHSNKLEMHIPSIPTLFYLNIVILILFQQTTNQN